MVKILILFLCCISLQGQNKLISSINQNMDDYEVINSLFSANKNEGIELNEYFLNYKGWVIVFGNKDFFDTIYGHCLDEKNQKILSLNDIVDKDDFAVLLEGVAKNPPYDLIDGSLLDSKIKLTSAFLEKNKNSVTHISRPIIIRDKAFVYFMTANEEKILILKRDANGWKIICDKYLFLNIRN